MLLSFGALLVLLLATHTVANDEHRLLVEYPMIISHDAGTGYLEEGVVNNWAKTQQGGLASQLSCGSRAFDLRPHVLPGPRLVIHHGEVVIDHLVSDALREVIEWANSNTTELVIAYVTDCTGDDCDHLMTEELRKAGVASVSDCALLAKMTVAHAKRHGRLAGGGSFLALRECVQENYDPTVHCAALDVVSDIQSTNLASRQDIPSSYCCFKDGPEGYPMTHLWTYCNSTSVSPLPAIPWMIQAHWQYDVDSIAAGVFHGSSILDDEHRSQVNIQVAQHVSAGLWPKINLLELDDVCDAGLDVLDALRSRF